MPDGYRRITRYIVLMRLWPPTEEERHQNPGWLTPLTWTEAEARNARMLRYDRKGRRRLNRRYTNGYEYRIVPIETIEPIPPPLTGKRGSDKLAQALAREA